MTILHAASATDFATKLREVLGDANAQPHSVDIAVGYFYLSGFNAVADVLASRPGKIRILIGRTDRPTKEEITAGYSPHEPAAGYHAGQNRRQETEAADETVANVGRNAAAQPQDDASAAGIKSLAALIADGKVEVRAYLKDRMHAKAYIGYTGLSSSIGTAIIGSSNFSVPGFTGNTELNYPVNHQGDVAEVGEWFRRLWQDGEPVSDKVVDQLQASWPLATPDPYLVYLKILHELYGDTIGTDAPPVTPPVELTDFQQDAVAAGLAMLERHNGCYIADVVGLGKTYIGAEILRRLVISEPGAGDPLVICPPRLTAMWERICDQFGIVDADVISMGRLTDANYAHDRALNKTLRNAGPVLIDEAHNFRNNNQRRRVLWQFLKGRKRHQTILLSATPQNLAPRDILRQLELFLDPERHALPGIAGNLGDYFPPDAETPIDHKAGEVLQHLMLRRRRQDITRHYPDSTLAGQPIAFPATELANQQYSLEHAYRQAGGLSEIVRLLRQHRASRYRPGYYLTDDAKGKPEYGRLLNPINSLPNLIRVLLFKRLESSIPAFRSTLQTLLESNRAFRNGLLAGRISKDDGADDANDAADDQDVANPDQDRVIIKGETYDAGDFRTGEWLDDLDADHAALRKIYDGVKGLTPDDDAKLHAVKSFVTTPGINSEKLLIFTESTVTAQYLYGELSQVPGAGAVDILTGGDPQGHDKMTRFSPVSNSKPDLPASEQTRILIATDVLSEGQNLQDCGRVLNYDLHWNPVTLIQRYGRVDRITTAHETIHLHNMLPDAGVDRETRLTSRLADRVQSFHDLVGLDDAILQQTERVNRDSIYAIYDGAMPEQPDDVMDNIAMAQEANAILNRIRREQRQLWDRLRSMPDGLRACRAADRAAQDADTTLVLVADGSNRQGYRVDANLAAHPLSYAELARAARCEPDTPAIALPADINRRVSAAVTAFQSAADTPAPASRRRERDTANAGYINRELRQLRLEQRNADELRQTELLRVAFTGEIPTGINDRITQLRRDGATGATLRDALAELHSQLPPTAPKSPAATSAAEGLRITCSMSTT